LDKFAFSKVKYLTQGCPKANLGCPDDLFLPNQGNYPRPCPE